MRIGTRGVNFTQVDPQAIDHFLTTSSAISQDHIAPTEYNSRFFLHSGLSKFAILKHDPRDALVSWAHHLERKDIINKNWHKWLLISSGIISKDYYSFEWNEKLNDLIKNYFPIMLDWINGCMKLIDSSDQFSILVKTYEEFVDNNEAVLMDIFNFYDIAIQKDQIVWPSDSKRYSNTMNLDTHVLKGIPGSYLDELSTDQIQLISKQIDSDLFKRFNWSQ